MSAAARQRITLRAIAIGKALAFADWLEKDAHELRATGDCDMWNLAHRQQQRADEIRDSIDAERAS